MNWGEPIAAVWCLACAYWLWRRRDSSNASTKTQAPILHQPIERSASVPGHLLPILAAPALIERTSASGLIEHIRTSMGLTPENWGKDVEPLLHKFIEFVQLLPASESHHHAQPGGLVLHTLEVASHALKIRAGCKLPPGGSPEQQIGQAAIWTYSVLIAALLHDIGKPIADVRIKLFGADTQNEIGAWAGLAGPMTSLKDAHYYAVMFDAQRDYRQHEKLPVMLLHAMVPGAGMQWLGQYPEVLASLVDYLQGQEQDNPIKPLIAQADSLSVSENLRLGSRIRFASAKAPALIERLHKGMCSLLDSGHLTFNRPGAACFVSPDGQDLWCVAGSLADQVRKHLDEIEIRLTGAAKLPSDNTRLFDTWSEYGALVTAPKEFGKGAVWWVRIEIDDWSQVLTVLRFPTKNFPQVRLPGTLNGTITPVSPSSSRVKVEESPSHAAEQTEESVTTEAMGQPEFLDKQDGAQQESNAPQYTSPAEEPPLEQAVVADIKTERQKPSAPSTALPPMRQAKVSMPAFLEEFLDTTETAQAAVAPPLQVRPGKSVQAFSKQTVTASSPSAPSFVGRAPRAMLQHPGSKPRPNAERFMAWVQQGLGTGELNYNESDAAVHFVDRGMLLLSPKLFKLYLENHPYEGELGGAKDALRALQSDIQRSGYVERNGKNSFHYYRVVNSDGSATGHKINTYLVPNPQAYIRPVPSPNALLQPCAADDVGKDGNTP